MKRILKLIIPALAALMSFALLLTLASAFPAGLFPEEGGGPSGGGRTVPTDDRTFPEESTERPDDRAVPGTGTSADVSTGTDDSTSSPDAGTEAVITTVPDTSGTEDTPVSTGITPPEDTSAPAAETEAPPATDAPETGTEPETGTDTETAPVTAPETVPAETGPAKIPVERIEIVCPSETVAAGKYVILKVNVFPENATDRSVSWSISCSANTAIINAWGRFTAVSAGSATVYASAKDGSGVRASVKIRITDDTPVIGISCGGSNTELCVNMVERSGASAVLLPYVSSAEQAEKIASGLDGIVFTGGEDLDPSLYGEEKLYSNVRVNALRDKSDMLLIKACLDSGMPMLCICRGMQLLNVALGGTLYQDIPSQIRSQTNHRDPNQRVYVYHSITVDTSSLLYRDVLKTETLRVNSWHHQSVKDPGKGLRAVAFSADDGVIEAMELDSNPYVIGVQFHPEFDMQAFFLKLGSDAAAFKKAGRKPTQASQPASEAPAAAD